jgi:hypothetical protein
VAGVGIPWLDGRGKQGVAAMTFKAQRGLEDRVAGGASAGRFAQRGRGFYRGRAGRSGWRFAGSRGSYFNRVVPR